MDTVESLPDDKVLDLINVTEKQLHVLFTL